MDKTTAGTHLVPMATVPPPHFLIPGAGYTLLPSLNGCEAFGGLASIHPFAGATRPITALPYYSPSSDLVLQQQRQQQQERAARGISGVQNGTANSKHGIASPPSAGSASMPPASCPSPTTPATPRRISDSNSAAATPSQACKRHSPGQSSHDGASPRETKSSEVAMEAEAEEDVDVKEEPTADETEAHHSCARTRRNSDSKVEESSSSKNSYPISALIDAPTSLTRSSRTSSLSSSLSSFRFGGSLNTLWAASQMNLSGKVPNPSMKSTGNLNAEAATMPSLGNQYFAFGGSLPELSLTSLTRLLPSSTANDSNLSSCPSLFTLFHSPLYVYPSQQHLTTPFINPNGSITFGSFLSSGTSLCSTATKSSPLDESTQSASNTDITGSENKVDESPRPFQRPDPAGSSTPCSDSRSPEAKKMAAVYSPIAAPMLGSAGMNVVSTLSGYNSLSPGLDSSPSIVPHTMSTYSSAHLSPTFSTSASTDQISTTNLNTLARVASAQQQRQQRRRVSTELSPFQTIADSKEGILSMNVQSAEMFMDRHVQPAPSHIQTVPAMNGVHKLESDMAGDDMSPSMDTMDSMSVTSPTHACVPRVSKKERQRPYKCDHPGCGRSFSFPAHLRSHIQQIHISYRPCKCEFPGCDKRFYTPQHLNVHRRVHTGERPFVCPYADCGKAFTTAGNLKNHIRTHTGERPYICKFDGCTKRFAEMSSLKKHELTHTGEKPYKCRVCGKAFSQAGSRNTHERKHSRSDDDGGTDGKLSRRYRIKRVPVVPKEEPQL